MECIRNTVVTTYISIIAQHQAILALDKDQEGGIPGGVDIVAYEQLKILLLSTLIQIKQLQVQELEGGRICMEGGGGGGVGMGEKETQGIDGVVDQASSSNNSISVDKLWEQLSREVGVHEVGLLKQVKAVMNVYTSLVTLMEVLCAQFERCWCILERCMELKCVLPNSNRVCQVLASGPCEGTSFIPMVGTEEARDAMQLAHIIGIENNPTTVPGMGDKHSGSNGSSGCKWYSMNGRELEYPSTRSVSIRYPSNKSYLLPPTICDPGSDTIVDGNSVYTNIFIPSDGSNDPMNMTGYNLESAPPLVTVYHEIHAYHDATLCSGTVPPHVTVSFNYIEIEE